MSKTDALQALSEAGVSIWLDDLSRQRITSGNLADLITNRHVAGVTSNPTIFAHALEHAEDYDEQVRALAARGASVEETVREITVTDVQLACDVFSGTWKATGGLDGRVSLEVDPQLTHDVRPEQRLEPGVNQRLGALHLAAPCRILHHHDEHAVAQRHRRPSIHRRSDRRSPREGDLAVAERRLAQDLRERARDDAMNLNHF